jgi:3-oxoadipate enol-lactonase
VAGRVEGYADVEGGRLFYEREGSGNPVVWLHAGFLDRRMWEPQFARFASRYDLIRYDQRGFGRSDPPRDTYWESRDLAKLLDHLSIGSAYLVGVAMGGRIALDFAADYPGRVDGLVVYAPTVSGYRARSEAEEALWKEIDVREDAIEGLARQPGPAAIAAKLDLWAPGVPPELRAGLETIAMENRERALGKPDPFRGRMHPPTAERLWAVLAPALVVTGEHDLPAFDALADWLAEKLPNAQRTVLAGGDHTGNLSQSEAFNELLEGFLARLDFIQMQRGSTH